MHGKTGGIPLPTIIALQTRKIKINVLFKMKIEILDKS